MGDKIAILKEGGHLAQYAPPAELLMYPAEPFVEDFVGADRALKRLALQRVRDIDLWKAAIVRAGEPVAEARRKLEDADLDIPLLVDDHGRPHGLAVRARAAGRARARGAALAGRADRRARRHPARRALRPARADTQYGPVVDADGKVAGVLSMEVLAHALSHERRAHPDRVRARRPRARGRGGGVLTAPSPPGCRRSRRSRSAIARTPSTSARATTASARSWILDNFNQYWHPLWEHVLLSVVPLADRLRGRHRAGADRAPLQVPQPVVPRVRERSCSRSPRSPST